MKIVPLYLKVVKNHYFKTKVVKLGIWSLAPNDCETWHGQNTNRYFKKLFGIGKGILILYEAKNNFQHAYVPEGYIKRLHARIEAINKKDYRALEKKLRTFYKLVALAKREIVSKIKNPQKLSNKALAREFLRIRDRIQHLAIYDQFTWLAEEYWTPKMEAILVAKLHLEKGNPEYNRVLFALIKPEEISTTLLEKKWVIEQAIKIKKKRQSFFKASRTLAKNFGWLPVFCYGPPWEGKHYANEIRQVLSKNLSVLEREYKKLKDYHRIRDHDFQDAVNKYHIARKDLQIFIEFGLAVDTRNEAEYFVGFGGFYLLPLYAEIAQRLYLSVYQVRQLYEQEMIDALLGRVGLEKLLRRKGPWGSGWGFDQKLKTRINFDSREAERLFKYIESYVKPVQGGDAGRGTCASPGKAVGKARIVPSPEHNDKVKNGDILITYSTTTDYLPAMKRAAAIIAEVGGLTCHAAVVSREFGIPCVVALTNAMKIFKDGEMIEVNADLGVVKKVN